ncbi:cytochrome P450 6B5-like [Epargyreus clarus]|uniref:cytochrome P450 6B5-like n=1 Tax=Epargyreus clarus TaxID=520877 RepID=UPI003C2B98B7
METGAVVLGQEAGRASPTTSTPRQHDLLTEGKSNEMSEDMLLAQAAAFLQAGFDTAAATLTFLIYELAYNPEAQDKLIKELNEAKEKHGDDVMEISVLSQLTYLNCVIDESLRKYPHLGWLDRIATVDYKIDDNLTIPAGTPVYVNAVGMHYDTEMYPEPDRFNPDRFLPENAGCIKPFAFLPFGEGEKIALYNVRGTFVPLWPP